MANFYLTTGYSDVAIRSAKICMDKHQLDVLLYILATQLCRMDDPQYGCMALSGMPAGEEACEIVLATMCRGPFTRGGVSCTEMLGLSIKAAAEYPDIDKHYAQMASGDGLRSNVYFDEELSVLTLAANGGQLLLALQLAHTEHGEEYARENLLKAYSTGLLTLQCMMPKDDILQSSCVMALEEIAKQYVNCMCCGSSLLDDLNWIRGAFERGRNPVIRQWQLWQEEHPEVRAYFRK